MKASAIVGHAQPKAPVALADPYEGVKLEPLPGIVNVRAGVARHRSLAILKVTGVATAASLKSLRQALADYAARWCDKALVDLRGAVLTMDRDEVLSVLTEWPVRRPGADGWMPIGTLVPVAFGPDFYWSAVVVIFSMRGSYVPFTDAKDASRWAGISICEMAQEGGAQ